MLSSLRRVAASSQLRVSLAKGLAATQALPHGGSFSNTPSSLKMTTTTVRWQSTEPNAMFCRQCEQTADHYACTTVGVCGKTPDTSAAQDALIHVLKSVSLWCIAARSTGAASDILAEANAWTLDATFSTLTNVNFDEDRILEYIQRGEGLKKDFAAAGVAAPNHPVATFDWLNMTEAQVQDAALQVSVPERAKVMNHEDAFSLNELTTYGMKGLCAYAEHVQQLRREIDGSSVDESVMAAIHEIYAKLADDTPDVDGLLQAALKVGEINTTILAALDAAHAELLGIPCPTPVRTSAVKGKCILVSGHDMVDLYHLLKQTEGTGIQVYTHGEMLPAHSYPKLHAFPHLAGSYGTAWQNQAFEFAAFPGPVVVTTNCVLKPRKIYQDRLYTINATGVSGVNHIQNRDFSEVIEQAQQCKGFEKTAEPGSFRTIGFNHRAVLPLADQIIEAATTGKLSRILLIGGCDGSQSSRSYFTDLADESPADSIILTLGCAKNRILQSEKFKTDDLLTNQIQLPNGVTIPRVLDMGQCNDSYSAVVVALELAKAMKLESVNELPLSLAISHLEQKATACLLTLLHLGVKNIRLGPSLPAYISPGVLSILQQNYNIMPTGDAAEDLGLMMTGN